MHDWSVSREAAPSVWPTNALVRVYEAIYMETAPELITLKFTRISIGQSNQAFSLGGLGYIFHNPCSCYAVNQEND